jgi:hypothetical protein
MPPSLKKSASSQNPSTSSSGTTADPNATTTTSSSSSSSGRRRRVPAGLPLFKYAVCLYVAYVLAQAAYRIRLFAIEEFGPVIHEFDPYFNYRATEVSVCAIIVPSVRAHVGFCSVCLCFDSPRS